MNALNYMLAHLCIVVSYVFDKCIVAIFVLSHGITLPFFTRLFPSNNLYVEMVLKTHRKISITCYIHILFIRLHKQVGCT